MKNTMRIDISYVYDYELEEALHLLKPMTCKVKLLDAKGKYKRAYVTVNAVQKSRKPA